MLTAEVGKPFRVANGCGTGELALDLVSASDGVLETIAEAQCVLPCFCSTRPKWASSTGLVKGWTLINRETYRWPIR